MRFFEYEAREIVKRAGIPVTDYGFTTDAQEAKEIAARIGGSTVIKSQVLSGGRMKAGGVKFADTPEEAEANARDILQLEINGHMPRGILVDPKAEFEQEYYAGVVWDGTRKQPVMIFSPVGGIDIEQVAEEQPDKVGRRHFSNILPFGEVWFYTDQAYLGNYFLFGSTQFYIDKIAELIRWKAWEVIGVGIGNVFSMSRLTYGGRASFVLANPTSLD